MPVFAVNSLGVSPAMSFICGLSTMATLIEPPFDDVAGDPFELFELPPQPTATAPTTVSKAAADPRRRVPLISSSSAPAWKPRRRSLRVRGPLIRWFMWAVKVIPGIARAIQTLLLLVYLCYIRA